MVTTDGHAAGWTEARLLDDALSHAGVTLETLATAEVHGAAEPTRAAPPPVPDTVRELLHTDVRVVLRSDVRDLVRLLAKRNRGE
jgi:hypothetical protein